MDYQDVYLETTDGVKLHGWFIEGRSDRVLLFFHGNAGNISHRLESIRQFLGLGLSVFIIDYRGYGQSEGETTEEGIYLDADTGMAVSHRGTWPRSQRYCYFWPLPRGLCRSPAGREKINPQPSSWSRHLPRSLTSPRNSTRGCLCAG